MKYRTYLHNGQVTDRIDSTEGVFTTPVEISIAEVAFALGVSVGEVTAIDTDVVPVPQIVIKPTINPPAPPSRDEQLAALFTTISADPALSPTTKAALAQGAALLGG